jgi:hypothetical protein
MLKDDGLHVVLASRSAIQNEVLGDARPEQVSPRVSIKLFASLWQHEGAAEKPAVATEWQHFAENDPIRGDPR